MVSDRDFEEFAAKAYEAWARDPKPPSFEPELRRPLRSIVRRKARELRRELVHAAGCVFNGYEVCAAVDCVHEAVAYFEHEAFSLGVTDIRVSVPRSLRHALGRWVGGE